MFPNIKWFAASHVQVYVSAVGGTQLAEPQPTKSKRGTTDSVSGSIPEHENQVR